MWLLSKDDEWFVPGELLLVLVLVLQVPESRCPLVEIVIACEKRVRRSERGVWKTLF